MIFVKHYAEAQAYRQNITDAVHYVLSWSTFVRRAADDTILVDTRAAGPAAPTPTVLWGEPLAPHSLENVGSSLIHIISVELKSYDGRRPA